MAEGISSIQLFTKLDDLAILPTRGSDGSGGYDLYTHHSIVIPTLIKTVAPTLIRTGVGVILPQGHSGMFWCRSSLGKAGLIVHGGFIDSDYRGELCVCISNLYHANFEFKAGDRICQMAIVPCFMPGIVEYDRKGGFGSTGK